ncbi:MAG: LLM class flavin-dependent oxidoreductase [Desulfitobacteriaceae bacterium]
MAAKMGIGFLGGTDMETTVRNVQLAEKLGFTSAWIAEDYFYGGAFSTAATCVAATSKIQLGIGVINPFTRHPVLTAMEVAALDIAAQGRIVLGMGTSNVVWMEKKMGIPFRTPLKVLRESVEIINSLLKQENVNYQGQIFTVADVHLEFTPYRSDLPVYFGVKGPQALRMAGELGDGILLSIMSSEAYIYYAVEQIKNGRKKVGRDMSGFEVAAYLVVSVDEDRQKARERVKPMIAKYLGLHGDHPILTTTGMPMEEIQAFRDAFLAGKNALHLVKEEHVDTFAVAGTSDECRQKLIRLKEAGVTHPIIFEVLGYPMEKTMEAVAKDLL